MVKLTERQRQVLDFIRAYTEAHGFAPSVRNIADEMGIKSTNGVVDHLVALERKGFIVRSLKLSRSIRLVHGVPPRDAAAPTAALAHALRRALSQYTVLAATASGQIEADLAGALAKELQKCGEWWPAPEEDERKTA